MTRGLMVSLCDRSGIMAQPWAAAGYRCVCVDLDQPNPRIEGNLEFVRADVFGWQPPPIADFVSAFPPCDDLASSGARWWAGKGEARFHKSLALVRRCWRLAQHMTDCWMIENPIGRLATAWRQPDFKFDPCQYAGWLVGSEELAEQYTKQTCLWTGPEFRMPRPKRHRPALGSRMHTLPETDDRKYLRSVTPRGFAFATYVANAPEAADQPALDW